jgi:hypothetical protein
MDGAAYNVDADAATPSDEVDLAGLSPVELVIKVEEAITQLILKNQPTLTIKLAKTNASKKQRPNVLALLDEYVFIYFHKHDSLTLISRYEFTYQDAPKVIIVNLLTGPNAAE